jgi:hypothetical protein
MTTSDTPSKPAGPLFLATAKALRALRAARADEDLPERAVTEAQDEALAALQACADAGAPVLRWMLIVLDDLEYLAGMFERDAANADRVCRVERGKGVGHG